MNTQESPAEPDLKFRTKDLAESLFDFYMDSVLLINDLTALATDDNLRLIEPLRDALDQTARRIQLTRKQFLLDLIEQLNDISKEVDYMTRWVSA